MSTSILPHLFDITVICLMLCAFASTLADAGDNPARTTTAATLQAFQDPPSAYRTAPLWVWNDRMTPALIDRDLNDMKAKGIGGAFIHPRPGLITPYLSEEWLSLVRHAVQTGKKLGMKVWIYDENSYPSGFAGGIVPATMPDAKRAGLRMRRMDAPPAGEKPLIVLKQDAAGYTDITAQLGTKEFGAGSYRVFDVVYEQPAPWHGGFTYVDVMRPEVTREFIRVTMGAYEKVIGDEFGKTVPGVFQDEAEVRPANIDTNRVVQYTPALFDRFRQRFGYDLRPHLVALYETTGEWRKVRHDFYALILELFIDGWAKPYLEYCEKNNLLLTGHYWEHEWPRPVMNPDNMAFCAYAGVPGVDILMNEWRTDMHGQFGNARAVKEIRSAANQLGKERTLSETFGAGGWEMTFADQKRIADWEYALGVNLVNQHLTYVTVAGARKRDHPLSFSYHEPWWEQYRALGDYYGRLSTALTSGEQRNDILVLEPTTTAWMHAAVGEPNPVMDSIGTVFQNFVNALEADQVEYDLGSENILRDHAKVEGTKFTVGKRSYKLVVLPAGMESIEGSTLALLRKYVEQGGLLLCIGDVPRYVDARPEVNFPKLLEKNPAGFTLVSEAKALAAIRLLAPPVIGFRNADGTPASIAQFFHHRRVLDDGEMLFLANTKMAETKGEIVVHARSAAQWDLFTGAVSPYPVKQEGDHIVVSYAIPAGGSLMLHFSASAPAPVTATAATGSTAPEERVILRPQGPTVIERVGSNVLTLDHCDLTIGGVTTKDLYFYEAQKRTWQAHGFAADPWDNAVQYRSSILDRDTFAVNSGFTADFHFIMENGVDTRGMRAVVERPGVFRVAVNGTPVKPLKGQWWLDKSFGVYEIGAFVKPGDNVITVIAQPFTIHTELEPVYVLGNFSLENAQRAFTMVPATPVRMGPWNEQGMPFYAAGMKYTQVVSKDAKKGKSAAAKYCVQLGKWKGVVASVMVNGKDAGIIAFAPSNLDITKLMKIGKNTVSVIVYGSLKNTLGPHHGDPPLGMAWPGSFQKSGDTQPAPGSTYSVLGYGFMEGFSILSGE
ncbi:MAG: hypothetical protein IPI01_16885 [Ignavibacteriae bacterium]|nr:hypothetical protein [Ignavibacteriota bacterium]